MNGGDGGDETNNYNQAESPTSEEGGIQVNPVTIRLIPTAQFEQQKDIFQAKNQPQYFLPQLTLSMPVLVTNSPFDLQPQTLMPFDMITISPQHTQIVIDN